MSEKWKSLPRKYCEICKCWFGDNKASIAHHEGGKNHKDNVVKYLKEVRIRSSKKNDEERLAKRFFAKIEGTAREAYHRDILSGVAKPDSKQKRTIPSELTRPASPIEDPPSPPTNFIKLSSKSRSSFPKPDKKKHPGAVVIPPAKKIKPDPDSRTHPYGMWVPVEKPKEIKTEVKEQPQERLEPLEFTEKTLDPVHPAQTCTNVEFSQPTAGFRAKKRNFRRPADVD